ncbi:MAG: DNA polymerase III subunit delta [Pseudomonadota bacterium]
MAALKAHAVEAFVAKPDANIPALLLYGPDAGAVRERSDALAARVSPDRSSAFNYAELTDADLKADPARLMDEAAAIAMFGGGRVVRVRTKGDASAGIFEALLKALGDGTFTAEALIIVEAGELAKTSKLRKAFEGAKRALALPCYADEGRALRTVIVDALAAEGLRAEPDALEALLAGLGVDRGVTRQELEKLILYKGPKGARAPGDDVIERADVKAVFSYTEDDASAALMNAAAGGRVRDVETELGRLAAARIGPGTYMRSAVRHFDRLRLAAAHMAAGDSANGAIKKLRPQVHFKDAPALERQLGTWTTASLDRALADLFQAEAEMRRTGSPENLIAERALFRIAQLAARRTRRSSR